MAPYCKYRALLGQYGAILNQYGAIFVQYLHLGNSGAWKSPNCSGRQILQMFSKLRKFLTPSSQAPKSAGSKIPRLRISNLGSFGTFLEEINTKPQNPSAAENPPNGFKLQNFQTPVFQARILSGSEFSKLQIFNLQNFPNEGMVPYSENVIK